MRRVAAAAALLLGVHAAGGCASSPAEPPPARAVEPFVYVRGEVDHPGRIPAVVGRGPLTFVKAVALCEDFKQFADRRAVKLLRETPAGRTETAIDFLAIVEGDAPDPVLQAGDVVVVGPTYLGR